MRMESHRGFANAVVVRPMTIDDISNIRHLHALSLRCLTGLGDDDLETLTAEIQSPFYTDKLMSARHLLAFLDGMLVGSAGWSMCEDGSEAIELRSVFVHPLFARCGIGRRLVRAIEGEARSLGFSTFSTPVAPDSPGFFERLGYRVVTRRRAGATRDTDLPMTVMRRTDRSGLRAAATPVHYA